jgi:cytochrome c-type biogenesis protein CcmE
MNRRGNGLLVCAFIAIVVCLAILWMLYAFESRITLSSYEQHDQDCITQDRGRLITVNGFAVGCTGDATNYRGSLD